MPTLNPPNSLFVPERIHVLEVLGNAIVGGMERWVERMVEHLPPERFRTTVLCPFESMLTERLREQGVPVHVVPMPEDLSWTSVNQARALVDAHGVHVLHAHLPNAHLLAGVVGRLTDRPVLTTIHGRQITLLDLEVHRAVGSHLSVVCRHSYYHALGLGVEPRLLSCDPNGVDTEVFQPRRARGALQRSLKLAEATPLVGFVGRLSLEKGPEVLVRAALVLRTLQPDAHMVFVGEGPCRPDLEQMIASFGLQSSVHLLGVRDDMPTLYSEFDVLASTSFSEALPLAIMEAMACALPVVATRVGGVPDLVEHGRTGWLTSAGDFEDIARCLSHLLADRDGRRAMGQRARSQVVKHWKLDDCVARVTALLERLTRGRERAIDPTPSHAPEVRATPSQESMPAGQRKNGATLN